VLCLGETMALFVPAEDGPVADVRTWTRTVGGAESNVACHLAGQDLELEQFRQAYDAILIQHKW